MMCTQQIAYVVPMFLPDSLVVSHVGRFVWVDVPVTLIAMHHIAYGASEMFIGV